MTMLRPMVLDNPVTVPRLMLLSHLAMLTLRWPAYHWVWLAISRRQSTAGVLLHLAQPGCSISALSWRELIQ